MYGCSKRRNNDSKYKNKYVSVVILGPFIFNYIANIIRSKDAVTTKTSIDDLEKKLVRDAVFYEMESISSDSLSQLLDLKQSGSTGVEYRPPRVLEKSDNFVSD